MCDLCSSTNVNYIIELEDSRLKVCEACSSYGKIIGKIEQEKFPEIDSYGSVDVRQAPVKETETMQMIVKDYPKKIKEARERLGLKQEELARRIAEKESLVHNLESGNMEPNIKLARKLEKYLRISLVDSVELASPGSFKNASDSSEGLTIGDLIKKRKK